LNDLYEQDPDKAPKNVSIRKGTSQGDYNSAVVIRYPMKMIGAGQSKTILSNFFGVLITGKNEKGESVVLKEKEKRVELQDMTISDSGGYGLFVHMYYRLSFFWCACVQHQRKTNQLRNHTVLQQWNS